MSHISVRGEQSTGAEISALAALAALSASSSGQFLRKTGAATFENATPTVATVAHLSSIGDVIITNVAAGQSIQWSGTAWVNSSLGTGTVTDVSITTANGVSGSVLTPGTTPAITITLGAITPTTVNGLTITANGTNTLAITAGKTLSVVKTMSFTSADDTGVYTLPTGTKTLIASDVATLSSLASIGTITVGVWQGTVIDSTYGGTGVNNAGRTLTISTNSGTLAFSAASKTLTIAKSITLDGTDATVMTFPTTSATIARTDAANTFTGASTASAWVLTSPTITTKLNPTTDDGAPLGDTTHNWSDLFLATGGVVNYANGNVVMTHSSGILTIGTGTLKITTPTNNTTSVLTTDGTQTTSNKRETKRVTTTAQSATPTVNTDNTDVSSITGLAQAITSMTTNLSGTPVAGDLLMFQITDNGTARAISWGSSFVATTIPLPTTTVISTMLRVGFQWNTATSKWDCIAVA